MNAAISRIDLSKSGVAVLAHRYKHHDAQALMAALYHDVYFNRLALVSSFGAESAVLLHMAAMIDPDFPIVFVDTGKLFGETRRYRDRLVTTLGLRNLKTVQPKPEALSEHDASGMLFSKNPDACCYWRKVEPLARGLSGMDAWISGRKRYHGGSRTRLQRLEAIDGRVKISPLADWTKDDIDGYFMRHALPRHPLEADGYLSIGCMPCTARTVAGDDPRSGRWSGTDKTECGIHFSMSEARRRAFV